MKNEKWVTIESLYGIKIPKKPPAESEEDWDEEERILKRVIIRSLFLWLFIGMILGAEILFLILVETDSIFVKK